MGSHKSIQAWGALLHRRGQGPRSLRFWEACHTLRTRHGPWRREQKSLGEGVGHHNPGKFLEAVRPGKAPHVGVRMVAGAGG